jgi:hypothetical protein
MTYRLFLQKLNEWVSDTFTYGMPILIPIPSAVTVGVALLDLFPWWVAVVIAFAVEGFGYMGTKNAYHTWVHNQRTKKKSDRLPERLSYGLVLVLSLASEFIIYAAKIHYHANDIRVWIYALFPPMSIGAVLVLANHDMLLGVRPMSESVAKVVAQKPVQPVADPAPKPVAPEVEKRTPTERRTTLQQLLQQHGDIGDSGFATILQVDRSTVYRDMKAMMKDGTVVQNGAGRKLAG